MNANASMPQQPAPMSMAGRRQPRHPRRPPARRAERLLLLGLSRSLPAPSTDRFSLGAKGFLGNMSAGPIGALLGGIGAAVTGQPTDAGSIGQATKVQQQRALISGLQARGVSNADITAALANPEYLKKILDNNVKDNDEFRPATPQERQAAGMNGDNNTPLFINTRPTNRSSARRRPTSTSAPRRPARPSSRKPPLRNTRTRSKPRRSRRSGSGCTTPSRRPRRASRRAPRPKCG
jgi:hypothetical protein